MQANSFSGMGVAEETKTSFLDLKRKKSHRYVIFRIDDKEKEVIVEKQGAPWESYDDFTAALPSDDCRFAVYDYDFVTEDNCQKSKIFFIAWLVVCSSFSQFKFLAIYICNNGVGK
jgi:cofilin